MKPVVQVEEIKKEFNIKKNQIDFTASIIYSLGCSLIHMAMLFTTFFVDKPNIEKAREFDLQYKNEILLLDPTYDYSTTPFNECEYIANDF